MLHRHVGRDLTMIQSEGRGPLARAIFYTRYPTRNITVELRKLNQSINFSNDAILPLTWLCGVRTSKSSRHPDFPRRFHTPEDGR